MPSTLPGSFASAAAGAGSDGSGRASSRMEPSAFADWNRRSNGATQTFRRSSAAPANSNQIPPRDSLSSPNANVPTSGAYLPPHLSGTRSGPAVDTRYSKIQLLDLFRQQRDAGDLEDDLTELYVGDPFPGLSNGISPPKWGRRDESKTDYTVPGPDVCWERSGSMEPLGLIDLTEEEKELFATSVNSPLKGSNQSNLRDGVPREAVSNRKGSVSHNQSGGTPTTARSVNRRRDTSESFPFPRDSISSPSTSTIPPREETSETASPFGPPRRRTDTLEVGSRENITEEISENVETPNSAGVGPAFGPFKRSVTNPLGVATSSGSSNWPPQSPGAALPLGAFGALGIGSHTSVSGAKRPDLGPSRESRFRGLMSRAKVEEQAGGLQEKKSTGSIANVDEDSQHPGDDYLDTFPSDENFAGAATDSRSLANPDTARYNPQGGLGNATRSRFHGDFDGSGDNPAPVGTGGLRSQEQAIGATRHSYHLSGGAQEEPLSPTFTNPYSSPQQEIPGPHETGSESLGNLHLPGLGEYQRHTTHETAEPGAFNSRRDLTRAPSYDTRQADRGQYPSSSTNRGFQSLGAFGGLGNFGGPEPWSNPVGAVTPLREKAQFPDLGGPIGSHSAGGLQSPNTSGPDLGMIGRTGRLGSLFPTAMQEQMRNEQARGQRDERTLPSVSEHVDGLSRTSAPRREIESPFHSGQSKFEEFSGSNDLYPPPHGSDVNLVGEHLNHPHSNISQQPNFNQSQQYPLHASSQRAASVGTSSSNQPPAAQQKTMVMPDRIRWIYRDPQGNTQGPWSGLEMHDWYRAGFFSPELLVKKAEDADYEPLAQLIRRIGNSREPFLVPQIGIPGPPSSQSTTSWPSQSIVASPSATTTAATQPPFAGSFPSFGTTLTAEQQNALERRKQEEQYLMARQKEHLAQQQLHVRQMQGQHGVHPQQLQHHSSAQSLQSQPSYGSMTSPNGYQSSPPQGLSHMSTNISGGFDGSFRLGGGTGMGPVSSGVDNLGHIREEDVSQSRQPGQDAQRPIGRSQYQDAALLEERTATMLADRALLEREQAEQEHSLQSFEKVDDQAPGHRLQEFHDLRSGSDEESYSSSYAVASGAEKRAFDEAQNLQGSEVEMGPPKEDGTFAAPPNEHMSLASRNLSLTEQVQKAASSKESTVTSSWENADMSASEVAPPPQSASPLPAPAARRGRPNVADALAAESLSQSQSPAEETSSSSLAPWAKETTDTQKQPSLREIQEIEARKAAKQEELAAATRRAALEREMAILANQPPPAAPGLPTSSTWGSSESPSAASGAVTAAWAKPTTASAITTPNAPAKKSLQQIQAEEEAAARKRKASAANNAAVANQVTGTAQSMSSGKRYADLAGKAASPSPSSVGAWTTVGASGKAKAPQPPAPAPTAPSRSTPAASASAASSVRPKPTTSSSKTSLSTAKQNAQDELKRWATAELRPDLDKNIQVEDFVQGLLNFPPDVEMITEVVHGNSSTIGSRHFAEEFIRRRGLADKGKTDSTGGTGSHSQAQTGEVKGGGWNEVARKGSGVSVSAAKEDTSGAFKIVAAKKKGKR